MLHLVQGFFAPAVAVIAPGRVFREQADRPQPWAVVIGTCALTGLSAWPLAPFLRAAAAAIPGLHVQSAFFTQVLLLRLLVIAPLNTGIYLTLIALLLWTVSAFAGRYDLRLTTCLIIAFVAGIAQVLLHLFVFLVLSLRAVMVGGEAGPQYVATGLDLVFEVFRSGPPLLVSVARHLGVFDVWFVGLMTVGLVTMDKTKPRRAAITACLTYLLMLILLVGVDLFTGAARTNGR